MKKNIITKLVAYTTALAILGSGCVLKICRDKSKAYNQKVINYVEGFVDDDFMIAAHRGFSSLAVENTIQSLQLANDAAFVDYIELDARLTDDGKIVCSHDSFVRNINFQKWYLERNKCRDSTDNSFFYTAIDYKDVLSSYFNSEEGFLVRQRQLSLLGENFSLSTLTEALTCCENKTVIIDLKVNDNYDDFSKALYAAIKDISTSRIILQSSNLDYLHELQNIYPQFYYSAIIDSYDDFDICDSFQMIGIKQDFVSKKRVESSLSRGQSVSVWTINSINDLSDVADTLGEYYDDVVYITDYPDLISYKLNNIKLEKKKVTTQ